MNTRAQIRWLPDGHRLHLHDGPIDLIVEAFGAAAEVEAAYRAACERFTTVLDELCSELPFLRTALLGVPQNGRCEDVSHPRGAVARRMTAATLPYAAQHFITPMAAVAGAVADEILANMVAAAEIARAYVNDGGDIALHLTAGEKFVVGMVERPDRASLFGTTTLDCSQPVRGIATSGWRGRSFSLGMADAVTVLADRAATADAAATIIANAVDLPGHPRIVRVPARQLAPDSDLGEIPVTQAVGKLTVAEINEALTRGVTTAESLLQQKLIHAAALCLQGETRVVGSVSELAKKEVPSHEGSLVHA
ncbi:MAG: UPF0280 family protein [Candidatus Sulfotelmatobacter sp.]|jgi:ApbE superfamily uncharacterized protein (UPF0280 family)